jgi:general secretion pathway protein N
MSRRWVIWSMGLLLLALVALFPLRIALGLSHVERMGLAARAVAGPVWSGAIGDLSLRDQPLGSFAVGLDPLASLSGATLDFARLESAEGPLDGSLRVAGARRGIVGTNGRIATASLFGRLPVDAVELADATVLFEAGRCVEASGKLTAIVGTRIAGLDLSRGMTGRLACAGDDVAIAMASRSRMERIDLTIAADGSYRARMRVATGTPELGTALSLFGFRPSGNSMGLTVDGHF